jgi:predicted metal-dependent hydrolase
MQLGLPLEPRIPTPEALVPTPDLRIPSPESRIASPDARTPIPESRIPTLVFVRHPRARRYLIRVEDDGRVRVTVPRGGSKREAAAFAERERAWIEKQRRRVEEDRARLTDPCGAALPASDRASAGEVSVQERALRARAARELPPRLLELAAQHGMTVTRVSIRNQRWRWGSCSRSGHICLNWRLVQMPDAVRDYVMLHELMHLKRMDHSPRFWKLVEKACPHYQAARVYLRALSHA